MSCLAFNSPSWSWIVESCSLTSELSQVFWRAIGGRDPNERGGGFVVVVDEAFDGPDEIGDAVERVALPSVRSERRATAVPFGRQALRAHVGRGGDEPRVRWMVERVRRREDDSGLAGPARAPLRGRRDRQRKLAVPQQIVDWSAGRPTANALAPDLRDNYVYPTSKTAFPLPPHPERSLQLRPTPKLHSSQGVSFGCLLTRRTA